MSCHRCDGREVVLVERCPAACAGRIRHAPNCPIEVPAECPACAKERQGDDLPTGVA